MPDSATTLARRPGPRAALSAVLLTVLPAALPAGCRTPQYAREALSPRGPAAIAPAPSRDAARDLPIYDGTEGTAHGWNDLMDAVAWADVVVIGESHDDAVGHAVQLAVVEDAVERWPRTVLSMEMLERDEQPLVDDYFDGIIDAETFARLTFSENWGAKGMWHDWYQPIVDAARDGGGRVVAANAPRRYVRLAGRGGYERLAGVPPARRRWYDYPASLPEGSYRDRFFSLMTHAHAPPPSDDEAPGDAQDDDDAEAPAPPPLDEATVESMFRSQLVWDATMAASIARARFRTGRRVIHLVGQFHSDFEGGTVLELRKRLPGARILVISLQQAWPDGLRPEDVGRADLVVYTGERPAGEPEEEGEAEDERPAEHPVPEEPGDA